LSIEGSKKIKLVGDKLTTIISKNIGQEKQKVI